MLQSENTKDRISYLLKNYSRFEVEFTHGNGAYLYDKNGKEYLDFLSGIAVTGFGHSHPKIKKSAENQINKVWHTSNLFSSGLQEELAEKLAYRAGLEYVFFCNSGTEANEAAIKFARKWGEKRKVIITTVGSFHGRTLGSLSATGQPKLWEGFDPLTPGFVYVPYNDLESIENSVSEDTVAVMLEPIQGESGIIIPSDNYLSKVNELCKKYNLLLIMDEVQTGMGRTGKFFSYQWENVKPDIVTIAKGIANGLPLGAVLCSKEVGDKITPESHGSTFGGNLVSVAVANCVIDLITNELLEKILKLGNEIKETVASMNNRLIKEIRGKGLMIGIELWESHIVVHSHIPSGQDNCEAKKIVKKLLHNELIVGTSGSNIIRILPPFIITQYEIKKFGTILNKTLCDYIYEIENN